MKRNFKILKLGLLKNLEQNLLSKYFSFEELYSKTLNLSRSMEMSLTGTNGSPLLNYTLRLLTRELCLAFRVHGLTFAKKELVKPLSKQRSLLRTSFLLS